MGLFVTEYRGIGNYGVPSLPALASQNITISTAISTGNALGANTYLIGVQSDAGSYLLVGASGSTVNASSTNGQRIAASQLPQLFSVAPNSRITATST